MGYLDRIGLMVVLQAFLPVFSQLCELHRQIDEGEVDDDSDVVPPGQVGAMIVDWTDPQKASYVTHPLDSNS